MEGRPKDAFGHELRDGDLIAEGLIGGKIWDGAGEIVRRPIGLFRVVSNPRVGTLLPPERGDFFSVVPLRVGRARVLDDSLREMFGNDADEVDLYLNCWDGEFLGWDDVEVIGNVYDDFE